MLIEAIGESTYITDNLLTINTDTKYTYITKDGKENTGFDTDQLFSLHLTKDSIPLDYMPTRRFEYWDHNNVPVIMYQTKIKLNDTVTILLTASNKSISRILIDCLLNEIDFTEELVKTKYPELML